MPKTKSSNKTARVRAKLKHKWMKKRRRKGGLLGKKTGRRHSTWS